jgi:hypothetical protein
MLCKTLHPLLGIDKSNPLFEVLFNPDVPDKLLVHFGMKFLEAVPRNSFAEKLLTARLFNAGFNRKKLMETFGWDFKTMQRWGYLLKDGDWESIRRIDDGQGAKKKITEERLRYILELFDRHHEVKGCHIISYITQRYFEFYHETISIECIRKILKERKYELQEKLSGSTEQKYPLTIYSVEAEIREKVSVLSRIAAFGTTVSPAIKLENSCKNSLNMSVVTRKKSNYSPISTFSANITFPMIDTVFKQVLSCHHIGILLTRIFMDFISDNLGDITAIIRQWLAMILNGCYNIEQGGALNYRALELFVGQQKTSSDKQRVTLKETATRNNIARLFGKNIRMIKAHNDETFMLDPHGVPYSGQLKVLKCWLGGSHSIGKGYYLDLIHTLKGEPVFSVINDNYYDLRQRFFTVIKEFRYILGGERDRFLTIVVDRAIYDVGFMRKAASRKIHIITWEKNYKKGEWEAASGDYSTETFFIMKYRNSREDTYLYTVQFLKRPWEKEKSFAQYIILLSKPDKAPLELSVICTDFSREAQAAIKPILTRWLQENDIGYLISLGINQITSYSYHTYEYIAETLADRNITNREYSRMVAEKLKLKKKLGILLLNREAYIEKKEQDLIDMEGERISYEQKFKTESINDVRRNYLNRKLKKLNAKIKRVPRDRDKALNKNSMKQQPIRQQIRALDGKLNELPREVSRIDKLIREEYVRLNFMPKSMMDAVKITARNIIYQLLEIFRPIWNNYRNDLVILRELITAMGHIEETETTIIVYLNPTRIFSKKEKNKIALFCFQISNRINQHYCLEKTVVISLYEL